MISYVIHRVWVDDKNTNNLYYSTIDREILSKLSLIMQIPLLAKPNAHQTFFWKGGKGPDYRKLTVSHDDVLLFYSLSDVAPTEEAALDWLKQLSKDTQHIYLAAYSIHRPLNTYFDRLSKLYRYKTVRSMKYPKQIFTYACELRFDDPPVSLDEISAVTGIPRSTLSSHLRRMNPTMPHKRTSRPATEEELNRMHEIMSDTL